MRETGLVIAQTDGRTDLIGTLKPYPAYEPSGVEWLGDVPAHWEVRRLKHWVGMNEAVLPEATCPEFEFQYVEIGAVSTGELIEEPKVIRFAAAPSRARRMVRDGDTIVSTVRTCLKAIWFAEKTNNNLVCSTGFAVLTPRQGNCAPIRELSGPKRLLYQPSASGIGWHRVSCHC